VSNVGSRYPFTPFPEGWFFVCHARELTRDKLYSRQFHGQDIVAYRDAQGRVCVLDAYCPHLGAHLGKTGRLEGGALRCQFHGLRFDAQGHCLRRGAPALRAYPVLERNGFVFAYHSSTGAAPAWSIPELADAGHGPLASCKLLVRSHPQEMSENSVDVAHFAEVHGFQELEMLEPMHWQGPYLTCLYRLRVPSRLLERCGAPLRLEFRLHKWGLGYSLAELHWPAFGLSARQFVFPTPLDGELVELNLALSVGSARRSALLARIARQVMMRQFRSELEKDRRFWESKRYLARPGLDPHDGPIQDYRRYCRQFYPSALPQLRGVSGSLETPG
jgi:nitrite reductase/ring-hydroxylating ferredoxin subunit